MNGPKTTDDARFPAIDRLLNSADAAALISEYGRSEVKRSGQRLLAELRDAIKRGESIESSVAVICRNIGAALEQDSHRGIRRVFNLSGTLLHTNLGRALMPDACIKAVIEVMHSASSLEFDLESGRRGQREACIEELLCRLTGAEAATVVNNNAAALMLSLNTLALARAVPVSRGELVEIGGSFRIPDIIERSGCCLLEVGTTNRTHLQDFDAALGPQTALILKVHQSNYVIHGYTASVDERELARLCQKAGIPLVVDLGSGTLLNLEDYGLAHETTPMETLAHGADLVTFSGDKLLGGPQAGILVGRRDLIDRINANPMKRALRCDKMTIAALTALLRLYQHPQNLVEQLPLLRIMTRSCDDIRAQAAALLPLFAQKLQHFATAELVDCSSEVGSGALPDQAIASVGIALKPLPSELTHDQALAELARALRELPVPVIGRVHKGRLLLDCRCLEASGEFAEQLQQLDIAP